MTNLKIGTILIAKEDVFMNGESFKPWAIKDSPYKIFKYRSYKDDYMIIDEQGDEHFITMDYINQHFTIKRYTLSDLQERTDIMVRIESEEQAKKLQDAGIKFAYKSYYEPYYGKVREFIWLTKEEQQGRILLESIDEIDLGDEGKICKYCNAKLSKNEIEDDCYANPNNASKVINEDIKVADYIYELESQIARLKGEVEQLIEEKRILINQLKESYGIDRQSPDLEKRERMAWEYLLKSVGSIQGKTWSVKAETAFEIVDTFLAKSKEVVNG